VQSSLFTTYTMQLVAMWTGHPEAIVRKHDS